jgi:hypothetical protein
MYRAITTNFESRTSDISISFALRNSRHSSDRDACRRISSFGFRGSAADLFDRDGTTDITRTRHMSEPTDMQRLTFTRVLKGQILMGTVVFPSGITVSTDEQLRKVSSIRNCSVISGQFHKIFQLRILLVYYFNYHEYFRKVISVLEIFRQHDRSYKFSYWLYFLFLRLAKVQRKNHSDENAVIIGFGRYIFYFLND